MDRKSQPLHLLNVEITLGASGCNQYVGTVDVVTGSSGCDQWVEPIDVVTECGQ